MTIFALDREQLVDAVSDPFGDARPPRAHPI
jgi:hypothetical protein